MLYQSSFALIMHKVHKILIVKISKITHPTILQILIKMGLFILCFALMIKKIVIKARINNLASVKNKISAHTVFDQNVLNGDTLM